MRLDTKLLATLSDIRDSIARIAHQQGLSISAAGKSFLDKALQQHLDIEYAGLIQPVIESAIKKEMQAYSNRLAFLLVRVAFASEQTRSLVTNILSRQPDLPAEVLNDILDRSAEAAKSKITQKNPELEQAIAEVKGWFEKEKKTNV